MPNHAAQVASQLSHLAGPPKFENVQVRTGSKRSQITIPEGMEPVEAVTWIAKKAAADEAEIGINEVIDAYPLEGAVALSRALEELYGFVALEPTHGPWGSVRPPTMIGIEVAPGVQQQVPWGRMEVPGIDGYISTGFAFKDKRWHFQIAGTIKRKNEVAIRFLIDKVREIISKNSIYRGRVIRVEFEDNEENFNVYAGPRILDVSGVNEEELVFSEAIQNDIETNLFMVVEQTEQCIQFGIPLKRGVAMDGTFGVGKTLAAAVLSKKCEANGWTFIYLKDPKKLAQALGFARNYEPAVVFCEDIDQVTRSEENDDEDNESPRRSDELNEILNTLDGVDGKTAKIMVVVTTNNLRDINPAALRPGRIDSVITIEPPDAVATVKLIKLYGRGYIADDVDLTHVGEQLQGCIPALVREAVERARRVAIRRIRGKNVKTLSVTAADFKGCVEQVLRHRELMMRDQMHVSEEPTMTDFARELGRQIAIGMKEGKEHGTNWSGKALEASTDVPTQPA